MNRPPRLFAIVAVLAGCGQDGFLVTGSATGATTEASNTTGIGGLGGAGASAGAPVGGSGAGASGSGGDAGAPIGGQGGGVSGEICDNEADDDGDLAIDCADSDCAGTPACAGLVLNEVDYDQVGSDDFEFVEIYNGGATAVSLDGLSLVLVNGANGDDYESTALSGSLAPGAYLVVADPGVIVAGGATVVVETSWAIQQGPDGVALYDANRDALVDGLSYGGDIGMVSLGTQGSMFSLVDGSATTAADSGSVGSLIRSPNGGDTGNDAVDWVLGVAATPGGSNL